MIYRFKQPILLSNGKQVESPVFIDDENDKGEVATKVREQCAKEEAETPTAKEKKKKEQ